MIAFDTVGRGEPLVLLHGVGANRGIWRHVVQRIATERPLLAPDLPGFGDSPPAGGGFRFDETADALADAVGERVTAPFDLAGNSLGGAVALILALQRPELVHRLVLVAPAGFSPTPKLVAAAAGRLSGPAIASRRLLGSRLMSSEIAPRVLLWGTVAAPQSLSAQDGRAMLQASRGSTRIGAAVAALLGADLVSQLGRLEVNGSYYLSTPNRVSGDTLGQGLLVHKLNFEPTWSDPLGDPIASLPATEPVAAGPNPTNESCRRREARGLVDPSLRCPTPPRSPTPPPRATRSGPACRPRRDHRNLPGARRPRRAARLGGDRLRREDHRLLRACDAECPEDRQLRAQFLDPSGSAGDLAWLYGYGRPDPGQPHQRSSPEPDQLGFRNPTRL